MLLLFDFRRMSMLKCEYDGVSCCKMLKLGFGTEDEQISGLNADGAHALKTEKIP